VGGKVSDTSFERAQQLIRPDSRTKFHIDYDWWERADRDLAVFLRAHLCPEHQRAFAEADAKDLVDHVDPETGEVRRVPGMHYALMTHCSRLPDYLTPQTSLVNAVFRTFLANGNQPLSSEELADRLGRPAAMIVRTLSTQRVYRGIRPYLGE
jgi:hypothetical protein